MGWILLGAVVFGVLCAVIGKSRGRSSVGWFCLGFFFGPAGLIAVIGMSNLRHEPNERTHTSCPECLEPVLKGARVCKHCGNRLAGAEAVALEAPAALG